MEYFSPSEIKNNKEAIQKRFEIRPDRRLLALKGRNVGIFERVVLDKEAKVLDLGTGSGAFLKAIYDRGYANVYACDIDNYTAADFRPLLKGFQSLDISFENSLWPEGFFDAVTAWEVFEHLENPHAAVREIRRVLKPGGLFIFSVPNIFHIVSRLVFLKRGLFPRWNETNNHISVFPHGIFEKSFLKYFDLVEEGYVHSKVSLPLFNKIRFFPENKWFGNWVYYILKKNDENKRKE